MKEWLDVMKRCALFQSIAQENYDGMLSCLGARPKRWDKGECILAEGDRAGRLGILLSGKAQVVREDYDGNRSIITHLEPGDLFAEAFACAGAEKMPVSVVAAEPVCALLIDANRLMHPCQQGCGFHRQMIDNLIRILASKNLVCNQKIEVISKRTTRDKLMTYLLMQSKRAGSAAFTIPYDRQELADYLEVDRSGLSAEISKLRRKGVLECHRSRFRLLP